MLTGIALVTFSNIVIQLFSQTIPNVIWSFFKDASGIIILASVFFFALIWLIKAKPHNKPKNYSIMSYDVFGKESKINGLRTEFKNHDVAWSFMKQYKQSFPLYNFAMVSREKNFNKKTIFRYI